MKQSYGLKPRNFIPLFGQFMYENRTLEDNEFMENSDSFVIDKAIKRNTFLKYYSPIACIATGFFSVGAVKGLISLLNN